MDFSSFCKQKIIFFLFFPLATFWKKAVLLSPWSSQFRLDLLCHYSSSSSNNFCNSVWIKVFLSNKSAGKLELSSLFSSLVNSSCKRCLYRRTCPFKFSPHPLRNFLTLFIFMYHISTAELAVTSLPQISYIFGRKSSCLNQEFSKLKVLFFLILSWSVHNNRGLWSERYLGIFLRLDRGKRDSQFSLIKHLSSFSSVGSLWLLLQVYNPPFKVKSLKA